MIKLIIVEDEILERTALKLIIEKSGLPIEISGEAGNVPSALDLIENQMPDVIFVDIKMPGITGLELIRKIHGISNLVKFVIISAYDEFDYAKEAVQLGVFDYLVKPVRESEIHRVLNALIQKVAEEKAKAMEEVFLREQLNQMMPYIKTAFMVDLLLGNSDSQTLIERASFLGFSLVPSIGLVVDIDEFFRLTEKMSEGNRQLAKKEVFLAVESALSEEKSLIAVPMFEDKIMVLLGFKEIVDNKKAKEISLYMAEKIRKTVQRKTPHTCAIGIGRYCKDVSEIGKSFDEARNAGQLGKIFLGGNRTIHVDDLKGFKPSFDWYPYKAEKVLEEKLINGDKEGIIKALDELFNLLSEKISIESEKLRIRLFELIIILSRAAAEGGANTEKLAEVDFEISEEILRVHNNKELIEVVRKACMRFSDLVGLNYLSIGAETVRKAKIFLQKNYHKDISLEEVSQMISLNPHYFSRLFKKEVGMNFIDYLSKIRIEQAKKMLLQTSLTVGEISNSIGYHDANYFSRVFSKIVGVSPKKFRMKMIDCGNVAERQDDNFSDSDK